VTAKALMRTAHVMVSVMVDCWWVPPSALMRWALSWAMTTTAPWTAQTTAWSLWASASAVRMTVSAMATATALGLLGMRWASWSRARLKALPMATPTWVMTKASKSWAMRLAWQPKAHRWGSSTGVLSQAPWVSLHHPSVTCTGGVRDVGARDGFTDCGECDGACDGAASEGECDGLLDGIAVGDCDGDGDVQIEDPAGL